MTALNYHRLLLICIFFAVGCKEKKQATVKEPETDHVTAANFTEHFVAKELPYVVTDSIFSNTGADTLKISQSTVASFIPDSILTRLEGKNVKTVYYPLAKYTGDDTYLFLKQSQPEKKAVILLVLDKANAYVAAMPILNSQSAKSGYHTVTLDKNISVTKTVSHKNDDGSVSDGRDVYALNNAAHKFDLIMTDSIGDDITEVVNPIDTLPTTIKGTGDFGTNKMNLISLRDGKKPGLLEFYMYIDKNSDGECIGELRGEATLKSPTVAVFKKDGELCSIEFKLGGNSVTVKELASCGTYRSMRCTLDGSYPRKKSSKKNSTTIPKKEIKKVAVTKVAQTTK